MSAEQVELREYFMILSNDYPLTSGADSLEEAQQELVKLRESYPDAIICWSSYL